MDDDLAAFLAQRWPVATDPVLWGERMRLRATAYLSHEPPPLPYISSVRAVILRTGSVLVQQDKDNRHIIPGGRREAWEVAETTLRREVAEETGWSLGPVTLLGFTHFHHLAPKPVGYSYPYPDFCWLVYTAEAAAFVPEATLDDGYEVGSEFLSVEEVSKLALTHYERAYLDAAIAFRRATETPGTGS